MHGIKSWIYETMCILRSRSVEPLSNSSSFCFFLIRSIDFDSSGKDGGANKEFGNLYHFVTLYWTSIFPSLTVSYFFVYKKVLYVLDEGEIIWKKATKIPIFEYILREFFSFFSEIVNTNNLTFLRIWEFEDFWDFKGYCDSLRGHTLITYAEKSEKFTLPPSEYAIEQ